MFYTSRKLGISSLVLSGWAVVLGVGCGEKNRPQGTGINSPISEVQITDLSETLVNELVKNKWPKGAAERVVELNGAFFLSAHKSDPAQLERIITILGRLGGRHDVIACVERVPSVATLLGFSVNNDPRGPEKIAKTIPKNPGRDQEDVLNLYGLHGTPEEAVRLSEVLFRDSEIVLRLWNLGDLGSIPWLANGPKEKEAREIYLAWVRTIYTDALNDIIDPAAALGRANALMQIHSKNITSFLEENKFTPQEFKSALDSFQQLCKAKEKDEIEWGLFCCDPRIWEFHKDFFNPGWKALEKVGPLAIDISLDKAFNGCRQKVMLALSQGNYFYTNALHDPVLRGQPLFSQLLCRNLGDGPLSSALDQLAGVNEQGKIEKLKYWASLKDAVLVKEVGPPPEGPITWLPGYSVWELMDKKMNGQETTWLDLAFAGVDAAEMVFMTKGASKGLKLLQKGLEKKVVSKVVQEGIQKAAKEAGEKSARNFYPWVLRETYETAAKKMRSVANYGLVDITDLVRFSYGKTGLGNNTFKRISGLDAKVFMRTDRRVVFDVPNLVSNNHVIGKGLRVTAEGAVAEGAISTPIGHKTIETGVVWGEKILTNTEKQTRAWKENLALWWVAINEDGLQKK